MTQDLFDRSRLKLRPLCERQHDLDLSVIRQPERPERIDPAFDAVAGRLASAKARGAARILMMGAHVLRSGVQRYLFELMQAGLISHIAVNGACLIHDFEFALIGATTESVARYIRTGEFGLWTETGRINDIISHAARDNLGAGEALGRAILEGDFPHKDVSLLAQARRLGVPVTVHVGIGYDIVHEHPNCDGAAWGQTSYMDFLRYAHALEGLEGGAVLNFGSAVMGPEVFLKALAMARNVAAQKGQNGQEGRSITDFFALVCDLADLPRESLDQELSKGDPRYYFRPWKTMLVRTVADGGQSHYVAGPHAETIPQLWAACLAQDAGRQKP
ncbi:MAG: hypothetical protein A2051_08950 [Desulfovibrionales bacterium GWA2_65_9]|nr:MAG: hypothetical protein A2051_08950 [Desulfovibrionales bacterium GWA2_65_9]